MNCRMSMLLTLGLAVTATAGTLPAAPLPVLGTGWNADLVVEATTNFTWEDADLATSTEVVDGVGNRWVFYENGWGSAIQGINSTGVYVGPSGATYDIEPYNVSNAILNAGTLTLGSGGQFSDLAFLTTTQSNTGGSVNWTATVNFSDASSTILNGVGDDWINPASTQVVESNHGLGALYNTFYNGNLFMVERTFTLSASDQAKTITSIDFALTGGDNFVIHAVSGTVVPEPSALALACFGGLAGLIFGRRGRCR